jgi:hypothetical protein
MGVMTNCKTKSRHSFGLRTASKPDGIREDMVRTQAQIIFANLTSFGTKLGDDGFLQWSVGTGHPRADICNYIYVILIFVTAERY